jgi:MscS family membrane protein
MNNNNLFTFLLIFISCNLYSQIDSAKVNLSPYGVVYNHLYYLQDDSYVPELAAFSFPDYIENKENLAIQLKKILDGRGFYVDINRLPQNNNYKDTLTNESLYFIDRDELRIYVEQINGQWYYSKTTIDQIPQLFEEVFPLGTDFNLRFHGPFWGFEVLSISVAKWLGLLMLLLFIALVFYLVYTISKWLIRAFLQKRFNISEKVNDDLIKVARSLGLLIAVRVLIFLLPMFQLPIRLNSILLKWLGVLSIFFVILTIVKIASIVFHYLDSLAKKTKNTLDDQLLPVMSRVAKWIIWSIGIIYVLEFLNVNVTALLAGISIGGLAIALAAQDTVKNFFGSIMIFVDRPFQIGDWIHFDEVDGTVEEVGMRSTRIRTFANSVVYVPNGMLSNKVVNNMGLRQYRRFKTELGVTYNTAPEKINLFVKGIRAIIESHPTTRKDYFEVHLNSFGDSAINILLYCFFEAKDWTEELIGRHEVMYAILLLADDLGISFAFPSQSIYMESMASQNEGQSGREQKPYDQQLDNSLEKINSYFSQSREGRRVDKIKPLGGE